MQRYDERDDFSDVDALFGRPHGAAPANGPAPDGTYICRVANEGLFRANSGTPGLRLVFAIDEGPHAGREIKHAVWLSERALPYARRDLAKLGIERSEDLKRPLPPGLRVRAKVQTEMGTDSKYRPAVKRYDRIDAAPIAAPAAVISGDDGADVPF